MSEKSEKKVLVCTNKRFGVGSPSCFMRGSEKMLGLLKEELAARGKNYPVEEFLCFGQCSFGPALSISPGGEFFLGAKPEKVSEIADFIVEEMSKSS